MPDFVRHLRLMRRGWGTLTFQGRRTVREPTLQRSRMNHLVPELLFQFQENQWRAPGGMLSSHPAGRLDQPFVGPGLLRAATMIMNVKRSGPLFPKPLHEAPDKPRGNSQVLRHDGAGLTGQTLLNDLVANGARDGSSHDQPPWKVEGTRTAINGEQHKAKHQ